MHSNDYCQESIPPSPCRFRCVDYQKGFFGKPTKSRTSEPSMFEILTWNQNENNQRFKSNNQDKNICSCNCKCNQNNFSPQKDQNRNTTSHSPNHNSLKRIKQDEARHNQTEKQKPSHKPQREDYTKVQKARSPKQNSKEQSHVSRPKSAGPTSKTVKILTSPIKNERLAPQPTQHEEEPIQVKEKLIEKFKQTTRWIPNSAFTTYFGKPAFQNYGRCNTNPTFGGLMYGNYLKSHNIQPHRGVNSPKSIQSYNVALSKAQQAGAIYPYPPKVGQKQNSTTTVKNNEGEKLQCSQIYPEINNMHSLPVYPPNLYELQKFGGKGLNKVSRSKFERSYYEKQNENNYANEHQRNNFEGSKKFVN